MKHYTNHRPNITNHPNTNHYANNRMSLCLTCRSYNKAFQNCSLSKEPVTFERSSEGDCGLNANNFDEIMNKSDGYIILTGLALIATILTFVIVGCN